MSGGTGWMPILSPTLFFKPVLSTKIRIVISYVKNISELQEINTFEFSLTPYNQPVAFPERGELKKRLT